ncbi:hypothetical protein HY624_02390 [Candidatus Uhrbacteria bacterium]|nr:hypothetical protein [Candidatus Uhrbacteria bacterium]
MFVTLLNSLIVVLLMSTTAVASLSGARAQARDAKRVSTVMQYKTGLELYAAEHEDMYPVSGGIELGRGNARVLGQKGFSADTNRQDPGWAISPINPDPDPTGVHRYMYWSNGKKYVITFDIESEKMGSYVQGKNLTHSDTSSSEPSIDQDSDGLPDRVEALFGTSPLQEDTDGDGYTDTVELQNGFNPNGPGMLAWGDAGRESPGARDRVQSDDIIARDSIHWHAQLSITIKGKPADVPADIGLGTVHEPLHTHIDGGMIHIEYGEPGVIVKKEDVKLGKFFRIWGKRFDRKCIFNYCNGSGGTVRFRVNGQQNTEFDNYVMHDNDQIEIMYE